MLRKEYGHFISDKYDHKEVYAHTTVKTRTRETTKSVFAGLYPNSKRTKWDHHIHSYGIHNYLFLCPLKISKYATYTFKNNFFYVWYFIIFYVLDLRMFFKK